MDRSKLIQTLEVVGRALERNNVLPIFEYFCFTGETVYAWNDSFGIVAPWKIDKPFAVHGPTFLKLLTASKADEIEIEIEKDKLVVFADRYEYSVPIKAPDDFVWKEPTLESGSYDKYPDFEGGVITGIKCCLATCSENLALEAFARIYIGHINSRTTIYSTDGDALTKYTTTITGQSNVCLSRAFCDAIIKIGSTGNAESNLLLGKEWVCRNFEDYRIYGRNLGATTFDYETNIGKILGNDKLELIDIPKTLDDALSRARVVADIETSPTKLYTVDKELFLVTETPFGEVLESIKVKHPEVEVNVSAELLQKSMVDCTQFRILKNCCVFKGEEIMRLVSNL